MYTWLCDVYLCIWCVLGIYDVYDYMYLLPLGRAYHYSIINSIHTYKTYIQQLLIHNSHTETWLLYKYGYVYLVIHVYTCHVRICMYGHVYSGSPYVHMMEQRTWCIWCVIWGTSSSTYISHNYTCGLYMMYTWYIWCIYFLCIWCKYMITTCVYMFSYSVYLVHIMMYTWCIWCTCAC